MPGTGAKFIQDVSSSIHITIMHTATRRTNPAPYSKACDTFRPRIGQSAAIRTGLGCITLVDFFKPRAMLDSLVRQLISKLTPACIQHRLGHVCFCQTCGIDVAYRDVIKLTHDAGAELVVKVVAAIRHLRVYRLDAALFARSLRSGQYGFSAAVDSLRLNLLARGQGGEVFQAQVNTHALERLTNASGSGIDLNDDVQKPVAPTVAGEVRAVLDFPIGQSPAVKDSEGVSGKAKGVALALEFPALERHPAERPLAPVAQKRPLLLATRLGVLLAHGVDRARVKAQLFAGASSQHIQIKAGEPLPAKAQSIFLPVVAVVPDEIAGPALAIEQASQRFDTVSVDQQHTVNINSTLHKDQQPERYAFALYLPGLKAGVSREL